MGEIYIPGPVSGRRYGFVISGDQPTVDEQMRIDAAIRQQEGQFADEYEAARGVRPLGAEQNVLEYLGEFPKGIARGGVGILELGALGLAGLLPEDYETPTREFIRGVGYELKPQVDIGYEETVAGKFGEALGSFVPLAAASVLAKRPILPGTLAAAAGAGEASERARAADATVEERSLSMLPGAAVGLSELVPIRFMKALGRGDTLSIGRRLARIAETAGVEGVQEAAAEIAQNLISKGIYNPEQGVFTNTGEALGYGAGVGGLVQGLLDLAIPGKPRAAPTPPAPPPTSPEELAQGPTGVRVAPSVAAARDIYDSRLSDYKDAGFSTEEADALAAGDTLQELEDTGAISDPLLRPLVRSLRIKQAAMPEQEPDVGPPTPPLEAYADELGVDLRQSEIDLAGRAGDRSTEPVRIPTEEEAFEAAAALAATPPTAAPTAAPPAAAPTPPAAAPSKKAVATAKKSVREYLKANPGFAAGKADIDAAAENVARGMSVEDATADFVRLGEAAPTEAIEPAAPTEAEAEAEATEAEATEAEATEAEATEAEATEAQAAIARYEALSEQEKDDLAEAAEVPRADNQLASAIAADPVGYMRLMDLLSADNLTDVFPPPAPPAPPAPKGYGTAKGEPFKTEPSAKSRAAAAKRASKDLGRDVAPGDLVAVEMPDGSGWLLRPRAPAVSELGFRNAIPGRTTGAAGQVIPEGIRPEPGRVPEIITPELDRITDELLRRRQGGRTRKEAVENQRLAGKILSWWRNNNSVELQQFTEGLRDPTTDITTSADKQAVLNLLNSKFTQRGKNPKKITNPAWAAFQYFRKYPDPIAAIDEIVYDAIINPSKTNKITPDMGKGEAEAYAQGGNQYGKSAVTWLRNNLDPLTVKYMNLEIEKSSKLTDEYLENVSSQRDIEIARSRQEKEAKAQEFGGEVGISERLARDFAFAEDTDTTKLRRGVVDPKFLETEEAADLGLAQEDLGDIDLGAFSLTALNDMPMHPSVVRAIQRNDINSALDGIIATAASPDIARLAQKLRAFLQDTQMRIATPQTMADIREVFGDGRSIPAAGVYLPRASEAKLQRVAENNPQRAELRRQLNGTMLFNSQSGLTPMTFLHEAIHAATMKTLLNESHPLTKQVEALLKIARASIPVSHNGLFDRFELVSEVMTNREFAQQTAQVDIRDAKGVFSLRERLVHAIRNFGRRLMGKSPKDLGTVKDRIDQLFDDMLAPDVDARGVGSLYEAAFRPEDSAKAANSMSKRVRPFTRKDNEDLRRFARSTVRRIPYRGEIKRFGVRAAMPLMFVAENGKRYLPSAPEVYKAANEHGASQKRMSEYVAETLDEIRKWGKSNRDKIPTFEKIRYDATKNAVNPFKPESAYNQYELKYDVLDADGDVTETKTLRFKTAAARQNVYKRMRANPAPNRSVPRNTYDPSTDENKERIEVHRELVRLTQQLGPEGQNALRKTFAIPEYFRGEMQRVFRKRLETMLPGQRTMQERIYKNVIEKIFAETLIDPYQALQRRGNFGLSYTGKDPETGEVKLYKHAFASTQNRDEAVRLLQKLDPSAEIRQITPYDMDVAGYQQDRPSLEFVTALLNRISETESGDPQSLRKIEAQILDLVFQSTPESSFLRAYQKRKNVPGHEGDVTPISDFATLGDSMDNIRRNGMHLAAKVADIEYQVEMSDLKKRLKEELATFNNVTNMREPDPIKRAANSEEAGLYAETLADFLSAPTRARANWSRNLTAGGYALTLGLNVSTAAMTFFQMPTIIYPFLAGRYGSRTTMQSIGEASRILSGSGGERTVGRISTEGDIEQIRRRVGFYDFSVSNRDFSDPANAYLKPLRDAGERAGAFNRSLNQDVLDEASASNWVQKSAAYSGLLQHHSERLMRETTLLSTYLVELHQRMPNAKAMPFKEFARGVRSGRIAVPEAAAKEAAEVAVQTADMTNGSIFAASAPMLSQTDIGHVVYLFKRFPISMLNMLWHTVKRAADRSNDSADRRIAAMQFTNMAGAIALFAGASGLPGFHMIAALYDLLLKGEEDEDFETMVRTGLLGEVGLTGIVDYYAGVSVSSRIGLSGVFFRPGFNTEDQTALTTLIEGFGGPVVGLFTKYADRVPFFYQEGEYWRMTEALMPTAIANAMKSIRFYTEGARTLRHDPIIDDIGLFGAGAQFFGFMPSEYARQLAQNNYLRGVDNAINNRVQKLLRRLYLAAKLGDYEEYNSVMMDIGEFNAKFPSAAIDGGTIRNSLRSHEDTTSRVHHGITYSTKNEELLKRLAAEFGPATRFSQ